MYLVNCPIGGDEAFRKSWGRFERRFVSPSGISKIVAMGADTDVRHVLPSIRVPTLVIHRRGDRVTPVEFGRYLADHIPGARLTEFAGEDHFPWVGDADSVLDAVQQFVTGTRPAPRIDRVLATVLFVDIVDSTRHLSERGDSAWNGLLQTFYKILRQELELFGCALVMQPATRLIAKYPSATLIEQPLQGRSLTSVLICAG